MQWLTRIPGIEFFCYAPGNPGLDTLHYFEYDASLTQKSIANYLRWIQKIRDIVESNGIDVVHIPDGDSIMRYFGLGFGGIKCKRLVVTYHHFFNGLIRKVSYRGMLGRKDAVAVVHTHGVQQALRQTVHRNVRLCQYPAFNFYSISNRDGQAARQLWNIPQSLPVIGIIGSLNDYKNIPAFLDVLRNCGEPFHLLLCGEPRDTGEAEIRSSIRGLESRVSLCLRRLTDDEYEQAIAASDIVYCLYSHVFDGASGPLADGVCAGKMILACDHGSLGSMVKTNHLGRTAEVSDTEEVLAQTERALREVREFSYDDTAQAYRERLSPEHFQEAYRKIYHGI